MFSLNSLKPVSFSLQSFKMAEEANSGRSGYWKLFFYNMQEEALKPPPAPPDVVSEGLKKKRKTKKTKFEPLIELEEYDIPSSPLPLYRTQSDFLDLEINCLVRQNWVKLQGIKVPLESYFPTEPAANDEDEDELLLLLVA